MKKLALLLFVILAGCGDSDSSPQEYCYEHTFNDVTTGKQCFSSRTDYCSSLCAETNTISVQACAAECE